MERAAPFVVTSYYGGQEASMGHTVSSLTVASILLLRWSTRQRRRVVLSSSQAVMNWEEFMPYPSSGRP